MAQDNLKIEEKIIKLERDWAESETTIIEYKNIQSNIMKKIKNLKKSIENQTIKL